jgi:multidrug resistance efflux pump
VISRNVDVGQTVAASMSAPTLFLLAADLTKMQVIASLDESDVGRIRPNQLVSFRVDAYPNEDSRNGHAGAPAAADRAERRDVLDGDRRAESRT